MKSKNKIFLLIGISIAAFVIMLSISPIKQDPAFHNFADGREIASIPNFMNVISNLPFVLFGTAGLWMIKKSRSNGVLSELKTNSIIFFVGIFLTGIGSAFYHLNPNNGTLVWDRLPMTISFMGFFSLVVGRLVNVNLGKKLIWPLLGFGIASVLYWKETNDLRLYAIAQFLPIILTLLILLAFKGAGKTCFWFIILFYAIAKAFEALDAETYSLLGSISGHSIKHLFAAGTPVILLFRFYKMNSATRSL